MVRRQDRNILLLQPGNHGWIESRVFSARRSAAQIRPDFLPAGPDAGSNEEGIARRYAETRLLHPRLDVFNIDRRARLEILHALHHRDVDQDAAREYPV